MKADTLMARMRLAPAWLFPGLLVLISAAAVLAAYWPTLHYIFISDDTVYITENTKLLELPSNELWRLFIEPYNHYSEFLPLRELSYWFDMKLFGLNSAAFRMHNIILYLLCLPLVYAVTLNLWSYFRPADTTSAPWAAAAVTALFALHPALVESVVWISGRKYVLPNLFAMLALWFAVHAKREQGLSVPHAAAALVAFVAVMLSKSSYVALAPLIALLWVRFWRDIPAPDRPRSQLLWPLAILVLAVFLVMVFIVGTVGRPLVYFSIETITRTLAVLGTLARLAATPESRHFFYPVLEDPYLPVMVFFGVVILVAAGISIGMMWRKHLSLEGFSIIAFLLLCMPYIQIIPFLSPSLVQDRYLSLAAWPAIVLIVSLSWRLNFVPRTFLLLILALLWGFQTMERPRDWRSLEALIDADIRAFPGYYMPAENKIIYVQLKRGLRREAIETAHTISDTDARNIMIELIKTDYAVHDIAVATGNPQEAMTLLGKLELDIKLPAQASWNSTLNHFWGRVGFAVIGEWEFLATKFPDAAPVHYNAGLWQLKVHKYKEAVVHLRAAAESEHLPESARGTALKNLGLALIGAGDIAAAEAPLRAALQQVPPDLRAYCSLAEVYRHTGRIEEATRADAACPHLNE